MNERIRELIKQAGGHFATHNLMSNPIQYRESIELWDKNIEKFVELIVKECGVALSPMLRDMVSRGQAYNLIKEHFGVEEHAVCNHDWYSARNPVVKNGSVCVKCGAIDSREPEELKNERTN